MTLQKFQLTDTDANSYPLKQNSLLAIDQPAFTTDLHFPILSNTNT